MRLPVAIGCALVVCMVGCGGSSDGSGGGDHGDAGGPGAGDMGQSGGGGCTITLSGALSGTLSKCTVNAIWRPSTNQTGVVVLPADTGAFSTVMLSMYRQVMVSVGTWTEMDQDGFSALTIAKAGTPGPTWTETAGGTGAQGSFKLNLSAVRTLTTTSDGTVYDVHGTLDAVLPPLAGTGASGDAKLHATF